MQVCICNNKEVRGSIRDSTHRIGDEGKVLTWAMHLERGVSQPEELGVAPAFSLKMYQPPLEMPSLLSLVRYRIRFPWSLPLWHSGSSLRLFLSKVHHIPQHAYLSLFCEICPWKMMTSDEWIKRWTRWAPTRAEPGCSCSTLPKSKD